MKGTWVEGMYGFEHLLFAGFKITVGWDATRPTNSPESSKGFKVTFADWTLKKRFDNIGAAKEAGVQFAKQKLLQGLEELK